MQPSTPLFRLAGGSGLDRGSTCAKCRLTGQEPCLPCVLTSILYPIHKSPRARAYFVFQHYVKSGRSSTYLNQSKSSQINCCTGYFLIDGCCGLTSTVKCSLPSNPPLPPFTWHQRKGLGCTLSIYLRGLEQNANAHECSSCAVKQTEIGNYPACQPRRTDSRQADICLRSGVTSRPCSFLHAYDFDSFFHDPYSHNRSDIIQSVTVLVMVSRESSRTGTTRNESFVEMPSDCCTTQTNVDGVPGQKGKCNYAGTCS